MHTVDPPHPWTPNSKSKIVPVFIGEKKENKWTPIVQTHVVQGCHLYTICFMIGILSMFFIAEHQCLAQGITQIFIERINQTIMHMHLAERIWCQEVLCLGCGRRWGNRKKVKDVWQKQK